MKLKKAVLFLLALLTLATPVSLRAADHEKVFGVTSGWNGYNHSAQAGLFFQYRFSTHFRIEPSANIVLRKHDRDALLVDVNAHVPFSIGSRAELYPLAGLNFSTWSHHELVDDIRNAADVTNRVNRFGVNVGGGFGVYATSTLKLILEARYTFIKGDASPRISAGIGYSF